MAVQNTDTPKRRGRPPKDPSAAPKRRGRPPKKTADPSAAPKRRGRPRKNPISAPVVEEEDDDIDDDGDDMMVDEEDDIQPDIDDEPVVTEEQLLAGVDEEARMQNDSANSVLKRRAIGDRKVSWKGQSHQKYNVIAQECITKFGGESEVEIVRVSPTAAHIGIYPLSQLPNWRLVTELLHSNHWDGNAQKYKVQMMSTGRTVAAVCYLTFEESIRRKYEYDRMIKTLEANHSRNPNEPRQDPNSSGQQQWGQPQQQSPNAPPGPTAQWRNGPNEGQQGQGPWQGGQPPQQPVQEPQQPWQGQSQQQPTQEPQQTWQGQPQPHQTSQWGQPQQDPTKPPWQQQQGSEQWDPNKPPWQQPQPGMPPWQQQNQPSMPGGMPGMPPWQQQNPWDMMPGMQGMPGGMPGMPPWQQRQTTPEPEPDLELDDDDDDDDEDDDEIQSMQFRPHSQPLAPPPPDPRVRQMEKGMRQLSKELRRLQAKNNNAMSTQTSQQNYYQQVQLWQMLNSMNQQLEQMRAQVVEAKQKQEPPPMPPAPPSQSMTLPEIMNMVEAKMQEQREIERRERMTETQMNPQMNPVAIPPHMMPVMPQPAPAPQTDDFERTVEKFSKFKRLMSEMSPPAPPQPVPAAPPQPPMWMQHMMPPAQGTGLAETENKADDGNPFKVFDMGPFRYVTDQKGKAVDFFTMMMINADNVKSWIEPAIKAVGEIRTHVKDQRKQQETNELSQVLENMHYQMTQNQQVNEQQIAALNQRLAPSASTIHAMQTGMTEAPMVLQPDQSPPKRQPQPGPQEVVAVPSKKSPPKGILDGLAHAQKALQSPPSPK